MKISREEILAQLESVQGGLATGSSDIVEQSNCFVFQDKTVMTYNDEVACSCPTTLPIEGAVESKELLEILRKVPDETIDIEATDSEIVLRGKRRKTGIRLESEIELEISRIESPTKWKELPENFADAVSIVQQCAGKNETTPKLTCVHITPNWIEATDNCQLSRYTIDTGFTDSVLVRRNSIRHIIAIGMKEFSQTESWIHFRNKSGLVLSCRKFLDDFLDLNGLFEVNGRKMTLPKGLKEAAERAQVFSSSNPDDDDVLVQLKPGKLRVKGQSVKGWHWDAMKTTYKGPPMEFTISPEMLSEISARYNECEVSENRLKVEGSSWVYISALGVTEDEE